jgi:hypothetical protein
MRHLLSGLERSKAQQIYVPEAVNGAQASEPEEDSPYRDLHDSLDACGDARTILAAVLLGFLGVSAYFAI